MNITKRGTPPSQRLWKGHCQKCKSEAEAFESEMTHITHWREGGSVSWEVCPVCNAGKSDTGYGGMLFYPLPITITESTD